MLNSVNNKVNTQQDKDARVVEMKKAQNMFFKLLTTQLQCQDIENTVDMNQMTQQIFQMNELQTLIAIDHKLDEMNQNIKDGEIGGMASNMVGKYVLTRTDEITVNEGNPTLPVSYIIDGTGEVDATMRVVDQNNNLIHEAKLTDVIPNEMQNFELNFRDPNGALSVDAGIYKVQILAYDKKDRRPLTTEIYNTNKIQQSIKGGDFIMSNNQLIKLQDIVSIQDKPSPLTHNPNVKQNGKMTIQDLMKIKSAAAA